MCRMLFPAWMKTSYVWEWEIKISLGHSNAVMYDVMTLFSIWTYLVA